MADRTSRPHHSTNRLATRTERRIIGLRVPRPARPCPHRRPAGLNPATVHRVLVRYRMPRLADLDRATGWWSAATSAPSAASWSTSTPEKLGRIPNGGGRRIHGRQQVERNKRATTPTRRNHRPVIGYAWLHTDIDDHSRPTPKILADERQETAAAFWRRAHAWFGAGGITVQLVMTDNGSCYKSRLWRHTLIDTGAVHKRTRAYRPQTNGKVERFPPHPGQRVGLRPSLCQRAATPGRLARMAAPV